MANYTNIKLTISLSDTLSKLAKKLKKNYDVDINIDYDEYWIEYKDFKFKFFYDNKAKEISFFDIATTRGIEVTYDYISHIRNNHDFAIWSTGVAYLNEYIKNYIAKVNNVDIESEGIGSYAPFVEISLNGDDYKDWLKKVRIFHPMSKKEINKALKEEKKYLKELFISKKE